MLDRHDMISFKMLERLQSFWQKETVEWHIEHGLKLNIQGSPCLSGQTAVAKADLAKMGKAARQHMCLEGKMQTFCVTSMHQGTLTGHMQSLGNTPKQNEHAHECHYYS